MHIMWNRNCRLKVYLSFLFFISFLTCVPKKVAFSQQEFSIDADVLYSFESDGRAYVTQKITIKNHVPEVYVKSYSLSLKSIIPENIEVREGSIDYLASLKKDGENYSIEIDFPDLRVGKGSVREFEVRYYTKSLTKKIGEVWEVHIPKLSDNDVFSSYNIRVRAPVSFGKLTYFSTPPKQNFEEEKYSVFVFDKNQIEKESISLGFGNFQIFSFNLRYNLENPLEKKAKIKIAVPPDSFYQRVFYESIDPQPQGIEIDNDGNWLATFDLTPRQRLIVMVKGYAQIFPEPYPLYQPTKENLLNNVKQDKYWETEDPLIVSLASSLKSVEDVYRFVIETLDYGYERVAGKNERFGAKIALQRRSEAVCTEFTDLFIALLRAKGIPAREVNGYALSDDPKIKPLSLTKDVLHAWPEYWDEKRKVWVAVDPTWEKTTGGIDYFRHSDLKHFSFVFHGESSVQPLSPGSYKFGTDPSKDVFVELGGTPEFINNKVKIEAKVVKIIPLVKYKLVVKMINFGQSAIYNERLNIFFDENLKYDESIESVLPFSEKTIELDMPFSLLGRKAPEKISVYYHNSSTSLKGIKKETIIRNTIILFSLIAIILTYSVLRLGLLKNLAFLKKMNENKNSIDRS